MNTPPPEVIERLRMFLEEDVRSGDITTRLLGDLEGAGVGTVFSKCNTVLAGIEEVAAIADLSGLTWETLAFEGNWVKPGEAIMRLGGSIKTLLRVERVCLNIIQRMSGIATKTYNMVRIAREGNPNIRIAATRKTTPGFRYFEKRAVEIGGGDPHRYALDDMVLIKNNHIVAVGGVERAVSAVRSRLSFTKKVSCEVRSIREAIVAAECGADILLLDNFVPDDVVRAQRALEERGLREHLILEVSGGIDEHNAADFARTGVDVLSSGALTHSYEASDFNMLLSLSA